MSMDVALSRCTSSPSSRVCDHVDDTCDEPASGIVQQLQCMDRILCQPRRMMSVRPFHDICDILRHAVGDRVVGLGE